MMNGLDLFSGIGGISLALEEWVTPILYVERDKYAQSVLLSRMVEGSIATAPIFRDVTRLDKISLYDCLEVQREEKHMAGRLKKLTQDHVEEAIKLYKEGQSLSDLAHIFYVTRQSMHDLLKRRIELRPQKRLGKENHFYRGGKRSDALAHSVVERAIKNGRLTNPGKCSTCGYSGKFDDGRTAIQAHHNDYNKPLEVRWLCQKCHHEWHRTNKPVARKEVSKESHQKIDIIFGGFP